MNKKQGEKAAETSWGGVAGWYDELLEESPDSFQAKVIMPNLLRLLEPLTGKSVLDVACGQGYFSRAFHGAGAKVTGCDIAPELIKVATLRAPGIDFKVSPADDLSFAKSESYDAATIILAIQNIENLQGTVAECSRVLKSGGKFVFVLNHPAFRIPRGSSWQWDEEASKQYRRIDSYLSDEKLEIDMTPGEKNAKKKKFTVSFHRPLQSYFKALNKAGLSVTRLEEWISHRKSQKGPRGDEEDRTRKEIPMFLMIEASK